MKGGCLWAPPSLFPMDGFFLLDKPEGWTSRKAMNVLQRRLRVRGGYEGTLDPFASGLLLAGVGKATRFFPFFRVLLKEYEAALALGRETDTLDPEGEVVEEAPVPPLTLERVREVARQFVGHIEQVPPRFSALKVGGKRAYALAREGKEVALKPRKVYVAKLEVLALEGNVVRFRCLVGSGTYVRSLGRDMARALGTVGHLVALRRTAIGDFRVDRAKHPDEIEREDLIPTDEALYWMGRVHLSGRAARLFLNGGRVKTDAGEGLYRVYAEGKFAGVGRVVGGTLKPERLLPLRP